MNKYKMTEKFVNKFNIFNHDINNLHNILDEFMPLNANEKKWFSNILKNNRCSSIDKYIKLLNDIRNYPNKKIDNKEWFFLLNGEDENKYNDFINSKKEKFNNTRKNNFSKDKQCNIISNNIKNELDNNIDYEIIFDVVYSLYPLKDLYRKWLIKVFNNFSFSNSQEYKNHFDKIVNFTGVKSENYEWLSLLYGEEKTIEMLERKSNRFKGDKNHFYNHGGKYSIWSDKYIGQISLEEKESIRESLSIKRKNDNRNIFLRSHYNSDEEYIKFQTKDLQFYIDKYGEEEGFKKFEKKKLIWFFSRNGLDENIEKSLEKYGNDYCLLYILKISENIIKVGITTKSIKNRYRSLNNYVILNEFDLDIKTCLSLELDIKKKFNKYSIKIDDKIEGYGATESFYIECYDDILNIIKNKL